MYKTRNSESAFDIKRHGSEFGNTSILVNCSIPPNITTTDPIYRLLRLIMYSSDQETCVKAICKVLTTVNTPQGQTALIQLLKECQLIHSGEFVRLFLTKAFEYNCPPTVLLDNLYVLVDTVDASNDSGRKLLSESIRKHLIHEIALVMVLLQSSKTASDDSVSFEIIKSTLNLIQRLKIDQFEEVLKV